jgi:hypothetical protein
MNTLKSRGVPRKDVKISLGIRKIKYKQFNALTCPLQSTQQVNVKNANQRKDKNSSRPMWNHNKCNESYDADPENCVDNKCTVDH